MSAVKVVLGWFIVCVVVGLTIGVLHRLRGPTATAAVTKSYGCPMPADVVAR
jgi:hypothetical protein